MQRIDCDNCGKQILKANIVEGAVCVQCENETCRHTQIVSSDSVKIGVDNKPPIRPLSRNITEGVFPELPKSMQNKHKFGKLKGHQIFAKVMGF